MSASKYPQGYFHPKPCKGCSTLFTPNAPSHMYCGPPCAERGKFEVALQRKYKMGVEDYERMHKEQEALCAICRGPGFLMNKDRHKIKLVVDHCHATGAVRGLLCHNCNRALGLLKDCPERLDRAIHYLVRCND